MTFSNAKKVDAICFKKQQPTWLGTIAARSVLPPTCSLVCWLSGECSGSDFKKYFALLGWLIMSWWIKLLTLETSVSPWWFETESKWLRPRRCNHKCFCLFLCRKSLVHWREVKKKIDWELLIKMEMGSQKNKWTIQWDNSWHKRHYQLQQILIHT